MCFGIIVLWNDFIIPRVVRIHPLASPRILHLTDACQLDPSQLMDVVEDLLAA